MRLKLFLLMLLTVSLAGFAQKAGVQGKVINSATGKPVAGAIVMLDNQGLSVTTGPNGEFIIPNATPGNDNLVVVAYGFDDATTPVTIGNTIASLDDVMLKIAADGTAYLDAQRDLRAEQSVMEDEEGNDQTVGVLGGASDNIFYNAANYNFSIMRFRARGYDSYFSDTYINGIPVNDLARGRFNYSSLGGMTSTAFRNRTNTIGLGASQYGFGGIGGSTNFNTLTDGYAPGFRGSVAYTNSNYYLRAMAMYSTGINKHGWGLTVAGIGRYSDEGVQPGTFYNSGGYFLSLQKQFSPQHSLTLTAYGAPTQRATSSPTFLEAYDLAGDNLYNPYWGYQNGDKRSSKIVETFDPTFILNWLYKPRQGTELNTGMLLRWVNYSTSALNWYNARDPRPDYYRYLPSYWKDNQAAYDLYTEAWSHESFRQLDWDALYQANYLNNEWNKENPGKTQKGSTYIQENRHSNQMNFILNTVLNHRLNNNVTLQAGATVNYTKAHYYKTIRDLLGGEFWLDIDQFSERDYPDNPQLLQNDLNHPNRKVGKDDKFGYDYEMKALQANIWLQNMVTLAHWDFNYGLNIGYTQFYRDGNMRNGRAPENSYGKGKTHRFDTGALKAGAVYKINGRNAISMHAEYATKAPLFEYAYVSPRIKDTAIDGLSNTRIFSADMAYSWNYRRFRGQLAGYLTHMYDLTERTSFYDDQYSTFVNYALSGVHQKYIGLELGMAFKITPSVTLTAAGTIASYRYKNNPTGIRSVENGMSPDTASVSYLKNHHVGGTPSKAANIGIDWAAPKMWFFNINASWMGDSYVNLSPARHEMIPDLWTKYPDPEQLEAANREISKDDKLNNAFVVNLSIGKLIYINRKVSLNINLNIDNLFNRKNIMTYGYQQGRFDYTDFTGTKFPNKYSYTQGTKVFLNVGVRF